MRTLIQFLFFLFQTHGLPLPKQITPDIYEMVDRNATKIMYYANCGQHE